jgi:hypothetical protein
VQYPSGLELLGAETPARLTVPLEQWLPARYLASFTWPVPPRRVEYRGDGITYYNTRRRVDEPFIATVSSDTAWVVASFTRSTGNGSAIRCTEEGTALWAARCLTSA